NAYVMGDTTSADFPTNNAVQPNPSALGDAFVTKLNVTGSAIVYSTYLGGNDQEFGRGIAVDSAGNAYVTGLTASNTFPTANAFQPNHAGGSNADAFVTKLNPAGAALVYSTYLGGSGIESGDGIAVDASGNAYAVGETSSPDFPTANALQPNKDL